MTKKLREQWGVVLAARKLDALPSWSAYDIQWIERLLVKTRRMRPPQDEHA